MALLHETISGSVTGDPAEIARKLAGAGVGFERWEAVIPVGDGDAPEALLKAYEADVARVKAEGGYGTADVIDLSPDTPGLEEMLERFRAEHWHDEDEVRLVVSGRGVFHIQGPAGVLALEVEPGDFVCVPQGTRHWFDLCGDRRIRAIRLFQDAAGWTPRYTESGADRGFLPVCFGPSFLPPGALHDQETRA